MTTQNEMNCHHWRYLRISISNKSWYIAILVLVYNVVHVNTSTKQVPIASLRNGNVGSEEAQNKLQLSRAF